MLSSIRRFLLRYEPARLDGALCRGRIGREFIFPWDGRNPDLALLAHAAGCKVSALFDISGGAGKLARAWPAPLGEFWCGYAGGLGPGNVVEQVRRIQEVCDRPYWIDMQRGVRTEDSAALDLAAVRDVLRAVADLLGPDSRDIDAGAGKTRGR